MRIPTNKIKHCHYNKNQKNLRKFEILLTMVTLFLCKTSIHNIEDPKFMQDKIKVWVEEKKGCFIFQYFLVPLHGKNPQLFHFLWFLLLLVNNERQLARHNHQLIHI